MLGYQEGKMGMDCLGVGNDIGGICGGGILANTLGTFEGMLADCHFFLITLGYHGRLTKFLSSIGGGVMLYVSCFCTLGDVGRRFVVCITCGRSVGIMFTYLFSPSSVGRV